MITLFNQNDMRWRTARLFESQYTIGSSGCLLCAICNVYNLYENNNVLTPPELAALLSPISSKTARQAGLIDWQAVTKMMNCKINNYYDQDILSANRSSNSFLIGQTYDQKTQTRHFFNILQIKDKDTITIFDTLDGKQKDIAAAEIVRYILISFQK